MIVLWHGSPFDLYAVRVVLMTGGSCWRLPAMPGRRSGGMGHWQQQAGIRQWGLQMQDDLTDAIGWLPPTAAPSVHAPGEVQAAP